MGMLASLILFLLASIIGRSLLVVARKIRRSGVVNVALTMIAVVAFVLYGGAKPSNPGGGSGSGGSEQGGSGGGGNEQGGSGSGGNEQGGGGSGGQGGSESGEQGGSGGGTGGGGNEQGGSGSGGSEQGGGGSGGSGHGGSDGGGSETVVPSDAQYLLYDSQYVAESAESVPKATASVYDGYLYSGNIAGTIQVKVAKPSYGKSKVTATILIAGEKKKSIKGVLDVSDGTVTASGLKLKLEKYGMAGSYESYKIDGARNVFASKDKDEAKNVNAVASKWFVTVNVASDEGTFSVSIGKKGKTKVSGFLAGGTKVSYNAQLLKGATHFCVPVVWAKKTDSLKFTLWLPIGGLKVESLGLEDAVSGMPESLAGAAKFHVSADEPLWQNIAGFRPEFLPDGIDVGAGWKVAKAGKVSYKNGAFDTSKEGDNPSGLKLSYKAKDGTFKGSFKVYSLQNGKLKSVTASVNGVLVGSEAMGTATVKKVGGVPVSIGVK